MVLRYDIRFRKTITDIQKNDEDEQYFIDRLADDIFYHPNDYLDGDFVDLLNVEEE